MKKELFVWFAFFLSLSLVRAEAPQPLESDSVRVPDSVEAVLPVDLPSDSLLGDSLTLLRNDSLQVDSLWVDSLFADSLSLDSLQTADSLGHDSLLLAEPLIPIDLIRVETIDLDKYFGNVRNERTVPDTINLSDSNQPAKAGNHTTFPKQKAPKPVQKPDTLIVDSVLFAKLNFTPVLLDSMAYARNPLFNELVFMGKDIKLDWRENKVDSLLYGAKPRTLAMPVDTVRRAGPEEILTGLRRDARDYITQSDVLLYRVCFDQLPKLTWIDNQTIENKPIQEYAINEFAQVPVTNSNRIVVRKKKYSPWNGRLNVLLQFSQTALTQNWHKGGYDFFSLLGGLSGNLNYDNRKKLKWENSFEWRTGFNTVTGDTIGPKGGRKAMPSDDIFKVNSKFGVKATGDFYYSTSMEFQTQFFDNPKGINNYEMKARFLTPIRFNIGVGMEYKYKNLSINLAPLSFKYIYLADTTVVDGFFIKPTEFGIPEGENSLREIGSKLIVELKDYCPIPELKLNSRLNFYTNYEKVEIDWEIIAEFTINRFLSTRLMLNPRFDNTVILPEDEKARIQMKEMLTVGISYRIL